MDDFEIKEKGSFKNFLQSVGIGGGMLRDAEKKHDKVRHAVMDTGRVGKLKIELTYKRVGHTDMAVMSKVTANVPEMPLDTVKLYSDHRGVFEENPDQLTFENVHQLDDKKKTVNQA